jgi:hypothetical protein
MRTGQNEKTMPHRLESRRSDKTMRCALCEGKFGLVRHYSWRTPLCSGLAATVSPAIFWAIREQFRQSDSAATNEILKGEAEKFLESVRTSGCDDAECEKRSRELQDALFQRRVANPLVLPLVYLLMRNELEKQARAGADALLK